MAKRRSRKASSRKSRRSRPGRRHGSAYRPGLYGIHQGGLKNPAASKAEHEVAQRVVKALTKPELVRQMAGTHGKEATDWLPFYERKARKELESLAVIKHMHAFNVATDNYD